MKLAVSSLLVGIIALAASNNSNSQEKSEEFSGPLLSSVFPKGNVPLQPSESEPEQSASASEQSLQSKLLRPQESTITGQSPRVITQIPGSLEQVNDHGRVYSFQIPLNDNEQIGGGEQDIDIQRQYLHQSQPQNDGNNAKKNASENVSATPHPNKTNKRKVKKSKSKNKMFKSSNKDFTSIEDFQKEINHNQNQKVKHLNESQAIQGAGTGFLHVAHHHPEEHGQHGQHHHGHFVAPEVHHEIIPVTVHDAVIPHGHQIEGPHPQHHAHPIPIHVDVHHQHHELPKPLKPSVVHRDPHDSYHHHDKLRTQDKDHLHHHGHHINGHGFEPYHYDMKKIPDCAFKNKHFYNLTFCLEDHEYPLETILWAIHQYGEEFVHRLLSDVTYQSADNLVTGLTRAEEEGYTYKHYFGASHSQHTHLEQYKPPYHGYTYKTDYFKKGGYICPSDIYYGRPRRAMNTYGQWKVIVNVDHIPKPHLHHGIHKREAFYPHKGHGIHQKSYTQTLRLEQCIYPNAPCSFIDPHFHSKCIQKHNFVRLVAWTHDEGLHVDTFKLPIACSCHIPQPIHFYQESGHHEETHGEVVHPVHNYGHGKK